MQTVGCSFDVILANGMRIAVRIEKAKEVLLRRIRAPFDQFSLVSSKLFTSFNFEARVIFRNLCLLFISTEMYYGIMILMTRDFRAKTSIDTVS